MAETTQEETQVVIYSVSDAAIAELREALTGLTADTPEGYAKVKDGIGTCRKLRGEIEETRVEKKAKALEWGRLVDGEANRLKAQIVAIESPLKAAKAEVDEAEDRRKEAAELAEAKRLADEAQAKRDADAAEMAAARAELAALRRKMDDEKAADDKRRDEERKEALAKQQADADAVAATQAAEAKRLADAAAELAAERAAMAAERKAIDDAKKKADEEAAAAQKAIDDAAVAAAAAAEREAFERQARETAEREARERLEAEKREADAAAARAEAERIEAEQQAAALRPDAAKVRAFAAAILAVPLPTCTDARAVEFIEGMQLLRCKYADRCEEFAAISDAKPTTRSSKQKKQTSLI